MRALSFILIFQFLASSPAIAAEYYNPAVAAEAAAILFNSSKTLNDLLNQLAPYLTREEVKGLRDRFTREKSLETLLPKLKQKGAILISADGKFRMEFLANKGVNINGRLIQDNGKEKTPIDIDIDRMNLSEKQGALEQLFLPRAEACPVCALAIGIVEAGVVVWRVVTTAREAMLLWRLYNVGSKVGSAVLATDYAIPEIKAAVEHGHVTCGRHGEYVIPTVSRDLKLQALNTSDRITSEEQLKKKLDQLHLPPETIAHYKNNDQFLQCITGKTDKMLSEDILKKTENNTYFFRPADPAVY